MFDVLSKSTAGDVVPDRKDSIVVLSGTDTAEHAIELLAKHKILSAPVFNRENRFLGFIELADIISHVLEDYLTYTSDVTLTFSKQEIDKLLQASEKGLQKVIIQEIGSLKTHLSERIVVAPSDPLINIARLFSTSIHRVLLFDKDKKSINVLSQFDILKWLHEKIDTDQFKDMADLTLQDFNYKFKPLVSVKDSQNVLRALGELTEEEVNAVAIVDEASGRLVGNFSGSDLRATVKEKFPSFLKSVSEFLDENSPESLKPIVARMDTKLVDIIKELVENKIHHVWVVDNDFKPLGCMSTTDVIKIITNYEKRT